MIKHRNLHAALAGIVIAVAATACAKTSTSKTSTNDSAPADNAAMEWDATMHKIVWDFNDPKTGVGTGMYHTYTVADTARVNNAISGMKPDMGYSFVWTEPDTDGHIGLLVYETKPVLTDKVTITGTKPTPVNDGYIYVILQFKDAKRLETVTSENIGHNLALIVNGKFISAPQVNSPIIAGASMLPMPIEKLNEYFPNLDLEKLKQK